MKSRVEGPISMRWPHRPRFETHVPPSLGVLLWVSALTTWGVAPALALETPTPGAGASGTPWGRWRVVEQGWGWESRLHALEVRPVSSSSSDPLILAYERDAQGRERVWGSARIQRPLAGPSPARWMTAEWTSGMATVLLQLRARA